jgi:hypothetical protein
MLQNREPSCSLIASSLTRSSDLSPHYYTLHTERYMGTPQNNPVGYHDSSVMTHVPTMSGKLMLVHGLIDENVHFRHTARLINTLIQVRRLCLFVECGGLVLLICCTWVGGRNVEHPLAHFLSNSTLYVTLHIALHSTTLVPGP